MPSLTTSEVGVYVDDDGFIQVPPIQNKKYVNWGAAGTYSRCIHAGSMYTAWRSLYRKLGLQAGKATKNNIPGIYGFSMDNHKVSGKSVGYSVHSELFDDNIYWAPFYEIQVARFMAGWDGIGKITAGDQWVCKEAIYPGWGHMYHLTAVWFHALPQCDLEEMGKCAWVALDRFHKDYERSPDDLLPQGRGKK